MYCYSCGYKLVDKDYNFCPKCGANLNKQVLKKSTIKIGNNSVNIGGYGSNHRYHIDNINYNLDNQQHHIKYNIDKIKKIPLDIRKASIFSGFVGIVGFIGSIVSILSIFKDFTILKNNSWIYYLNLVFIVLGFGLLYVLKILKKQEFVGVKTFFGDFLFLLDKEDKIFRIKAYLDCPKCNGKINVIKLKNRERYVGICNKNQEHTFSFDYTTFKGEPITINEFNLDIN